MTHVLFVGGKPKNIPTKRFKKGVTVTHYQSDAPQIERGEFSCGIPDIVFCFLSYVSHEASQAYRNSCKKLDIPFIGAQGGFSHMITQAIDQGFAVDDILVNGVAPAPPKEEEEESKPAGEPDEYDYDTKYSLPRTAREAYVKNGLKVYTMVARNSALSLLIKREVMDDVCKIAADLGCEHGWLPLDVANLISEELEKLYELKQRGITVTGLSIQRNVNKYRNATTPKEKQRQKQSKPDKPKLPAKSKPSRPIAGPTRFRERDQEEDQKAINKILDQIRGKVRQARAISGNNAYEIFLTEMALHFREVDESRRETTTMLREIIDLKTSNASFLEQVVGLENELREKQDKIDKLEQEIKKWKNMATS